MKTVLLIDNDANRLLKTTRKLTDAGCTVLIAAGTDHAGILGNENPDIDVILAAYIPGSHLADSSVQVIHNLKARRSPGEHLTGCIIMPDTPEANGLLSKEPRVDCYIHNFERALDFWIEKVLLKK